MRKRSLLFSYEYAKVLRKAWQKGNLITSEDAASILYYEGKRVPSGERSRAIRNAVMTLKRMQNDGLVTSVVKNEKTRMRGFRVVSREELRTQISKELRELFGNDFEC